MVAYGCPVPVQRRVATATRRVAPRGLAAAPKWTIGLTALVGAWLGHFFEYARVAGWHAGVSAMTDSAHIYFFPAGAALITLVLAVGAGAARAWARLGRRLRRAQAGMWARPARPLEPPEPGEPGPRVTPRVGLPGLWCLLAVLQIAVWVLQENLETVSSGRPAPLLGVVGGSHWLAPVVQAEVALILATAYVAGAPVVLPAAGSDRSHREAGRPQVAAPMPGPHCAPPFTAGGVVTAGPLGRPALAETPAGRADHPVALMAAST